MYKVFQIDVCMWLQASDIYCHCMRNSYKTDQTIKTHGSESRRQEEAACVSSGPYDHYNELFTWMAALKF